jgi:hypothetical protein
MEVGAVCAIAKALRKIRQTTNIFAGLIRLSLRG